MQSENHTDIKTPLVRLKYFLLACAMISGACGVLFFMLPDFVNNWNAIHGGALAVSLSPWVVPASIGSLVLLLVAWALLLRLVDKDTGPHYQHVLYAATIVGVVAILVRIPMGFVLDSYLGSKNYSFCSWYTSASNFSPPVWVREPQYCVENSSHVQKVLMDWIESRPNGGRDVAVDEVRQKAAELMEAHAAGEHVY